MSAPPRGQVLVLACLTLLTLAMMLMLSFSLSNAVHERIRIQSHADAQAFTVATIEARALNVMAYTNRAIASMVVTGMSVHAWHAMASEDVKALRAGSAAFGEVIGMEVALCPPSAPNEHCLDAEKATEIMLRLSDEADLTEATLRSLEGEFNETVGKIDGAIVDLNALQNRVLDAVAQEIGTGGGEGTKTLKALRVMNAPRSTYLPEVHEINLGEFACAVEGWERGPRCQNVLGEQRPEMDLRKRSTVIEGVSNAARGHFQQYCNNGQCDALASDKFQDDSAYLVGLMSGEGHFCFGYDGKAAVTDVSHVLPPDANTTPAFSLGANTHGGLHVSWRHGTGDQGLASEAFSDDQGGAHSPGHSQAHRAFKGFWRSANSCSTAPCFINFRGADPSVPVAVAGQADTKTLTAAEQDLAQPSAFGLVRQDLGLLRSGKRGPWEVNPRGQVKVPLGATAAQAEVRLTPTRDHTEGALAVAKAKVYFHELGNPTTVPNMFDPFWRARLAPFKRDELLALLGYAHDQEAQKLVDGMWPSTGGSP